MKSKLLTLGNTKTMKGEKLGYITAVVHLLPWDLSGTNLCALAAVAGCGAPCLNLEGRGGLAAGGKLTFEQLQSGTRTNTVQAARLRRTELFLNDRQAYLQLLVSELRRFVKYARRKRLRPVVRLNGTSDLRYEDFGLTVDGKAYPHIFAVFPRVQFYDYTKLPNRRRALGIKNYHLTFSYSHRPEFAPIVVKALQTYGNAVNFAVVFKGAMPEQFLGRRVLSGDDSDLRFLDAPGHVMGLTAKGVSARRDTSGFMVP